MYAAFIIITYAVETATIPTRKQPAISPKGLFVCPYSQRNLPPQLEGTRCEAREYTSIRFIYYT